MEALAEAFDENLTFGEISLPTTIPWTPNNLEITDFANLLRNKKQSLVSFKVDVYDAGFPAIQGGKLTILEKNGQLSMRRGQFVANISGARGLYGNAIRGRKLSSLPLGGPITFTETSSRLFAKAHASGAYPILNYFAFAPVAIFNFFDTERPDYDNEFLALDTVNTIVTTGPNPSDWTFGRPLSSNPSTPAPTGNSEYIDYRTIPFFSLQFVFRQCFTAFGYTPTGPFLSMPWFSKLYLFNNFAIERYETATSTDTNRTINPANHMPDMLISDFIRAVCSTLGMYPVFTTAGNVELRFRRDRFRNVEVLDITPYVARAFTSTLPTEQDPVTGVEYDFSSDSQASERLPDLKNKQVVASVATRQALDSLNIGRTFTINDLVLVQSENLYYRPADATATPVLWEAYADNLYSVRLPGANADTDQLSQLPIPPLASFVKLNPATATFENQGYLAIDAPGSYTNNNLRTIIQPSPLRMFYIGTATPNAASHPVSHYHNRYPDGTRRSAYSLALQGAESIGQVFHIPWLQAGTQPEIVKIGIRINADLYKKIRTAQQLQIQNTRYMLYRIERDLPLPRQWSTITIELAII